MVLTALLFGLILIATYTDLRWGKIYNWTVYPGILIALVANAVGSALFESPHDERAQWWGLIGFGESLWGFFAVGGIMLVCYVLFDAGIGGGDLKLLAMVGAFWGLNGGLEMMLWTLIFSGAMALVRLVWLYGILDVLARAFRQLKFLVRTQTAAGPDETDGRVLRTPLNLAPSAAAAVVVVHFQLVEWF